MKVITVILAIVLISVVVWILFDRVFITKFTDPSTATIDRQIVENAINDMKSTLTEKEYEMMLTIGKDWEENTDGRKYFGEANPNLKVESGRMLAFDLYDCGFHNAPMSMIIYEDEAGVEYEVGVKYIRNIIEPDTDSPYHEKAEYGICYIYDDDPNKFVDDNNFFASVPYFAQNINYLEKVYDDLYIYVIYADPLA
ncbi:MAG: hypothetical protein K2K34_10245 [Oscillospiraceae bacterium]|nr:hypothetical protein [Oscillospiraceae bacterium]